MFLGKDLGTTKNYSEKVAADIDNEVKKILEERFKATEELLSSHTDVLKAVTELLLEKETISGDEFDRCFTQIEEGGNNNAGN